MKKPYKPELGYFCCYEHWNLSDIIWIDDDWYCQDCGKIEWDMLKLPAGYLTLQEFLDENKS